jgi:hypothetical protein
MALTFCRSRCGSLDAGLVADDDLPAAIDVLDFLVAQGALDDVGPALDALKDVLDVVRNAGHGLADRRQTLAVQGRFHQPRVLQGQARQVAHGGHDPQVVLGERGLLQLRVGVDHSDDPLAGLDRHADGAADAQVLDRVALLEPPVLHGVG